MTNFIGGLKDLHFAGSTVASTFNGLDLSTLTDKFITVHNIGDNVNTYGFGLSPYFISIAL